MVMEYVRKSWEAYKKNWMSFVVAELVSLIITGIIALIGISIIISSIGISTLMELYASEEFVYRLVSLLPLFGGLGLALIFFIISGLVWLYLKTGLYGMAAQSLRGRTKVDTMFKVSKKLGLTGIFTSIIVGIIAILLLVVLVGGISLTFPGTGAIIGMILFLLIMVFFSLTFPGIVVDRLGVVKTIDRSFNIVKKHYFKIFGLLLFYGVISIVIALIPIIGYLITVFVVSPMMWISLVAFYKRNK